jgi:hypothetical protein
MTCQENLTVLPLKRGGLGSEAQFMEIPAVISEFEKYRHFVTTQTLTGF